MTQTSFSIKLLNSKTEETQPAVLHRRSQGDTGGTKWNKLGFAASHGEKSALPHSPFNTSLEKKRKNPT